MAREAPRLRIHLAGRAPHRHSPSQLKRSGAQPHRALHIRRIQVSELPPLPPIELGHYRHYKGGEYEVMGVVRHSESLEPLVLYRPLYNDSGMWVRPFAMFLEPVEHAGRSQPRFSLVTTAASVTEADLAATVERMEARLSASKSAAVQQLIPLYHQLAVRFEQDLAARKRDVLLAKASALMLVQAAAQAEGSP